VISGFTGAVYCAKCCQLGLPEEDERPLNFAHRKALSFLRDAGAVPDSDVWATPRNSYQLFDSLVRRELAVGRTEDTGGGDTSFQKRLYKLTEVGYKESDSSSTQAPTGERRPRLMASEAKTEKAEKSTEVLDGLLAKVKAEIPGAELLEKKGYVTVKVGGKTIGYINGKHKLRIDGVVANGERPKLIVESLDQLDTAMGFLKAGADAVTAKQEAAKAKVAEAQAKRTEKAAERAERPSEAAMRESDAEVTPDPKPVKKQSGKAAAKA
jgi:hypothetical protein